MTSEEDATLASEFGRPSREAWLALVEKVLKGAEFEKRLVARTNDGLAIEPLYTRTDELPAAAAEPGSAPFTRGKRREHVGRPWDIRQRHAEPDSKLANAAILEDLNGGVTSFVLQIQAPGQSGLSYQADPLETALAGVPLDTYAIALDARENTLDAAGSLMELWREAEISENRRRGAFNLDPLGTLARTGTLYYPANQSCEIAARFAADCRTMAHVTALLADGRPYHEAGASEGQELAALLATLVAYLRACEPQGLRPRSALAKIAVAVAADADLFLTLAKLRAARKLVGRVAEACGCASAASTVPLWTSTSERMLTKRDPWVNILRATVACAGAAFGGADAITVLPFTWALGKPDAFARRIARNTHLVLQEESALGRVIDPAGGSWYAEKLTDELAHKAWALFQDIEARGGMARALESGHIQAEITKVAEARARDIAVGRLELTGSSAFPMLAEEPLRVEPHPMPEPVAKGGTSIEPLGPRRLAQPFERLRDATDAHLARTGRRPQVLLACLGALADHSARSTFMQNFLAAGGIEAVITNGFGTADEAAAAFARSGTPVACLCASDKGYAELGETTARALKRAGATELLLAGHPKDQASALKAAGIDAFVYAGSDAINILTRLHLLLGVAPAR